MQKKVDVSVIIVNYKVQFEVFSCIESIYKSKPKLSFEIIVVDNSEKDSISRKLKTKFPQVKYILPFGNLGYGAGNNLGVKNARGEFVLILNPDTRFKNNVLDILFKFVKKNKKTGAISPLLLKENGQAYDPQGSLELTPVNAVFSVSILNKIFPNNPIAKRFWMRGEHFEEMREVEVFPGTCFLINKNLFEKAGGYDESFFLYFEENDLSNRLRKLGYKLFIDPNAKLIHKLGVSTEKNPESKKYFQKSRFLYFRENYGLLKAVPTELFLRIDKKVLFLIIIFSIGAILRLYRLSETMTFIGDQGWYYISARDILLKGDIPLVGITSSHTWLHQGAFWTYILVPMFKIFDFNPVIPAYFTAILDLLTLFIVYKLAKNLFSEKVALFSAIFYAVSPGIISDVRMAYHTSVIPFFTALLILALSKWIKGHVIYFPFIIFLIAVLYNFEIATFSLGGIVATFFLYGFWKKKSWALRILNKKILGLSFLSLIIPLIPFIIYDTRHGFPQTLRFIVWLFYKIAVVFGFPRVNPNAPGETWTTWINFITELVRRLFFYPETAIAFLILGSSFLFLGYKAIRSYGKNRLEYALIFTAVLVPTAAYIVAKTNSAAYLLIFYPQIAIMIGILFGSFVKRKFSALFLVFFIITSVNAFSVFSEIQNERPAFLEKINASRKIINLAKNQDYNIIGTGQGSEYESHTKGMEYLTWWLGQAPSDKDEKLKFYVFEYPDRIEIKKVEE